MKTIIFKDVNTLVNTQNNQSIDVSDEQAIQNSLYNLFSCQIGTRPWLPEYGTNLPKFIFEPCDNVTAIKIEQSLIESIQRWEPRIKLLKTTDIVSTLPTNDGFSVFVTYYIPKLNKIASFNFRAMRG